MALPAPREGTNAGFSIYPATSGETTLAEPESILWSSIRNLCSRGVTELLGLDVYGIKGSSTIRSVANNVKLYIHQAAEFYDAAKTAKPNTAPLIYYYSFLNLAKALCEIHHPNFHRRPECYRHGISWRPSQTRLVELATDKVTLTVRGVWHVLWESLTQSTCPATNPTKLSIKHLFLYCPEIGIEVGRTFGSPIRLINVVEPSVRINGADAWVQFGVKRSQLRRYRLTGPALALSLRSSRSSYQEVKANEAELRMFELQTPVRLSNSKNQRKRWKSITSDIQKMNLFSSIQPDLKIQYYFALQSQFPFALPQLVVLYTILFWLGSVVRYDPHSVDDLRNSHGWILIDGFMSQSRLWLLELFEWAFYQVETTLNAAR